MIRTISTCVLRTIRHRSLCTKPPTTPLPPHVQQTPTSDTTTSAPQSAETTTAELNSTEQPKKWIGQTPLSERLHPNQKNAKLDSQKGIEQFLDIETSAGARRTGRAWRTAELRLKSFDDLHRLWYILIKERNVLLTEKAWCKTNGRHWNNGASNMTKVRTAMARLKAVVAERIRAEQKRELENIDEANEVGGVVDGDGVVIQDITEETHTRRMLETEISSSRRRKLLRPRQ